MLVYIEYMVVYINTSNVLLVSKVLQIRQINTGLQVSDDSSSQGRRVISMFSGKGPAVGIVTPVVGIGIVAPAAVVR